MKKQSKDIKTKSKSSIGYQGKVKVELRYGNKTINKSLFHNEGLDSLFNCLARSIAGNYVEAENLRPKFIKIFSIGSKDEPVPQSAFAELATPSNLRSLTNIIYSSEPNIVSSPDVKVTLKFLIPFTQLSSFEDLNMVALYSQQYKNNLEKANAYIIIKNPNDDSILSDLLSISGITPSSIDESEINKYNLFIEWSMIFKNI